MIYHCYVQFINFPPINPFNFSIIEVSAHSTQDAYHRIRSFCNTQLNEPTYIAILNTEHL